MRNRLERSLGALFVARQGRADCADLDAVLADWDGAFSVLWRKRVARHEDGCETCEGRARRVPALLLQGLAGAAPAVVVPVGIRHRVVDGARIGGTTHSPWSDSGFPPGDVPARSWRRVAAVVGGLVAAVLVVVSTLAIAGGDDAPPTTVSTTTSPPSTASTTTPTTTTAPGAPTTVAPPGAPIGPASVDPAPGAPSTTSPPSGSDPPNGGASTGDGSGGGDAPAPTGDPGGGSGGGGGDPSTGGTDTVPPTRPTRPERPSTTRPPASTGGGTIVSLPPRVPVAPRSPLLDPSGGEPVIR
jgi:hypothetical protein